MTEIRTSDNRTSNRSAFGILPISDVISAFHCNTLNKCYLLNPFRQLLVYYVADMGFLRFLILTNLKHSNKTADEEGYQDGEEENETAENQLIEGVIGSSLAELQAEKVQIKQLLDLAKQVYDQGHESKFERLAQILRDSRFKNEKVIIFTEHKI